MARILPHGWREVPATGAARRVIETLARLEAALPDDCTVYHGVHWTRLDGERSVAGEIDFVVVSPEGAVVLIEQKTGFLRETPEGLVKAHGTRQERVALGLSRSARALTERFTTSSGEAAFAPEWLLYCPDFTVREPAIAGLDPRRIVDATRREDLPGVVLGALSAAGPSRAPVARIHRFFRDVLELAPEIGVMADNVADLYTRLSGGLATWGRRLAFDPFRLHVIGTAGSGKTQLALAVCRDAVDAGRQPLYVCYNRPLADHMARVVPGGTEVATYHQLCERAMRAAGEAPDFTSPDVFRILERRLSEATPGLLPGFDDLIVDEGQDFRPEWRDALMRLLPAHARIWWLEDPLQNLYERPPADLVGWVVLRAETNYRSPRDVTDFLSASLGGQAVAPAGSPVDGGGVETITYETEAELEDATKRAITMAIGLGFRRSMIGVVTFRGREGSVLASRSHLGPHAMRAFTGRYDLLGMPEYTTGEILLDSVYRFKGRSAPCIVFTEIDFETLDERTRRKLFVGATRATMKLLLVTSRRSARQLGIADG
ncbi:MAG: AAA family ATPase [Betaproteobacteria bacterium]|nr:AAA family ATPase [Betaproteobacteria bacterium]